MAGSKTILFIEDDPFILDMYTRALTKAGYEVAQAKTGTEALELAEQGTYDLFLLDIMIPEKLGMQVLHELRNNEDVNISDAIIVILTNYAHDKETRKELEEEADGYLIKADTTPKQLVKIIKQFLPV